MSQIKPQIKFAHYPEAFCTNLYDDKGLYVATACEHLCKFTTT